MPPSTGLKRNMLNVSDLLYVSTVAVFDDRIAFKRLCGEVRYTD
jgi:hypothetical protein